MKKTLTILIITLLSVHSLLYGQMSKRDSFLTRLTHMSEDTNTVITLREFALHYFFSKPDSSRIIGYQGLDLARKLNYGKGILGLLNIVSESERFIGNYPIAIKLNLEALQLSRQMLDKDAEARTLGFLGFSYVEFREYRKALEYLLEAARLNKESLNTRQQTFNLSNTGNAYHLLNLYDSAMYYHHLAMKNFAFFNFGPVKTLALSRLATTFLALGQKDSAFTYYHLALKNTIDLNARVHKSKIEKLLAEYHEHINEHDSSLYYARLAFSDSKSSMQKLEILETSELLSRLFRKTGNPDSAYYYQDIAKTTRDSVYGPEKFGQLQVLMLNEQEREQKVSRQREQFNNRIKYIALTSALGVLAILAFILIRNNRHKQKVNNLLSVQKDKIEEMFSELKTTQKQLVQREKMASLGELTAGIAHEIQNPLNFVNNFSEVNHELLIELKEETDKGNLEEVRTLVGQIVENETKITQHGKRAEAIVKNMLQHSSTATGLKEPTDINSLVDEYLRLASHGLPGKEFINIDIKTDYDPSVGKLNMVPQEMGRVILNLLNNAFYAVATKAAVKNENYSPEILISTRKETNMVVIIVKDNGIGIAPKILDKIFQPFFTTKPTGQGTGLGLSLSYDIVTKGHGGELKVETKEGKGSSFIIQLPANI